jgi:hypothetical protein
MDTDDVADVLAGTLASALAFPGVCLEEIVLRTPSAVIGSAKGMTDHASAAAAAVAAGEPPPRPAVR